MGVAVYRWEPGVAEASVTYHSNMASFDPEDISQTFEATQVSFAAAPDGRVFVAPTSRDEYVVYRYSADGTSLGTIERPFERVRRSERDIERDMEMMRITMERRGRGAMLENWEPNPYHRSIGGMDVVGENQLWIRRGWSETPFFDVYDLDGNLLFTCSADGIPYSLEVAVEPAEHGALAYLANPEDYPRVYLLEMVEDTAADQL